MDIAREFKSFSRINIDRIKNSNIHLNETAKTSIELYNKAVENVNNRNEDMAAIHLKRAILYNPEFCEALLLLGLCNLSMGKEKEAHQLFDKVLEIEKDNQKAIDYIKEYFPNLKKNKKKDRNIIISLKEKTKLKTKKKDLNLEKKSPQQEVKKGDMPEYSREPEKKNINLSLKTIMKNKLFLPVLSAVIVIIIVLTILLLGNSVNDNTNDDNLIDNTISQEENDIVVIENHFEEADLLFSEHEYFKAGEKLTEIDYLSLEKEDLDKFNSMFNTILDNDYLDFYNEGKLKYSGGNYKDAIKYLMPLKRYSITFDNNVDSLYMLGESLYIEAEYDEAVHVLSRCITISNNYTKVDSAIYFLAMSYYSLEENNLAKVKFTLLLDKYPNSKHSVNSQQKLLELS